MQCRLTQGVVKTGRAPRVYHANGCRCRAACPRRKGHTFPPVVLLQLSKNAASQRQIWASLAFPSPPPSATSKGRRHWKCPISLEGALPRCGIVQGPFRNLVFAAMTVTLPPPEARHFLLFPKWKFIGNQAHVPVCLPCLLYADGLVSQKP